MPNFYRKLFRNITPHKHPSKGYAMTNFPLRPSSLAEFGSAIRSARQAQNLTLDELTAITGISKPYLSNIETARTPGPPSPQKLVAIANALGVPKDELLTSADWLRTPSSIRQVIIGCSSIGTPP